MVSPGRFITFQKEVMAGSTEVFSCLDCTIIRHENSEQAFKLTYYSAKIEIYSIQLTDKGEQKAIVFCYYNFDRQNKQIKNIFRVKAFYSIKEGEQGQEYYRYILLAFFKHQATNHNYRITANGYDCLAKLQLD